jgi:hypothetical protein
MKHRSYFLDVIPDDSPFKILAPGSDASNVKEGIETINFVGHPGKEW